MKRLIGAVMLLSGLLGLGVSAGGIMVGRQVVDNITTQLQFALVSSSENLETTKETLLLSKTTLVDVYNGLSTVEQTAQNASVTIYQTGPLLDQVSQIASQDVPDSLDTVQAALPNIAEVATNIDSALKTIDAFQFNQSILGFPLQFDLGIDYNPPAPIEDSINQMSVSLDELSTGFRSLEQNITVSNQNLQTLSQNVLTISQDLQTVNQRLAQFAPLIDDYVKLINTIQDSLAQAQTRVADQMEMVKLGITVLMVWIGLAQVVPLYFGWQFLTGKGQSASDV